MSKINDQKTYMKTISALKILAILAVGLMGTPALAYDAYVGGYGTPPRPQPNYQDNYQVMEEPLSITSVSPDEVKAGSGAKTITITGSGFKPSSIVKINGSNRYTTFIDDSRLLVQATPNDFYRTDGGFYLTVWNSNGDYSNAAFVKVKGTLPVATNRTNSQNTVSQNYGQNYQNTGYPYPANNNYGGYNNQPINYYPGTLENMDEGQNLASSVILGGNTFLPSGIVQWVLMAILIAFIVVLARKVFRAREHYDNTPLKHA